MRIEIDVSAANDPDAHPWLDRILSRIVDGWHVWDLTGLPSPDELKSTAWIRDRGRAGRQVRELLVESTLRSARVLAPHGRRLRVTARPEAEHELAPKDAFRLADERLIILVENRHSDGAFVERVVEELDRSLRRLWLRDGEPIRFDSIGGGGSMPHEVKHRGANAPYRPRLVAIIDSDRTGPDVVEGREAQALRTACEKRGLSCWVLAKREAENYLPPVLLRAKPNADDRHERLVDSWEALSDDQKDFFDMKRGLPNDPSVVEQKLCDHLPETRRQILADGFGPKVHECWTQRKARGVKDELVARGRGDLERGIALIRREV